MITVRDARPDDYAAYCRMFRELGVDDPTPPVERFVREMMPRIVMAENARGEIVGFALFQVLKGAAYVRNLVTVPEARRTGVGRALMREIASRVRAAGGTEWALNVKPDNVAAIALYESLGLRRSYQAHALKIDWAHVPALAARARESAPDVHVWEIAPEEDAAIEPQVGLFGGQIADTRALGGGRRVFGARDRTGAVLAFGVWDPGYPSIHPMRVKTTEATFLLMDAVRPLKGEADTVINLSIENAPHVADAILAAGGVLRLLVQNMRGPLPGP